MDAAACIGEPVDWWFPKPNASTRAAKAVCRGCPVRQQCLDHALEHDERFGVWGGLTEKERSRLRRRRAEEPWHGTPGGYTNHGCRCTACTAAHTAAVNAWAARSRDNVNAYRRTYNARRRGQAS